VCLFGFGWGGGFFVFFEEKGRGVFKGHDKQGVGDLILDAQTKTTSRGHERKTCHGRWGGRGRALTDSEGQYLPYRRYSSGEGKM